MTDRLRFAHTEIIRLSTLIDDYQQIELFRQNLVSSDSSLVLLSAVVAKVQAEELAMAQRLPQLKISFDLPESLPQIRIDADLLRRAISALVNYAVRGAGQGAIVLQGSINAQGWLKLAITGSAFELAGAPTDALLDESRQFLSSLGTEHKATDWSATFISIVLARLIVEYYGGKIEISTGDKANPGFVILLPVAV